VWLSDLIVIASFLEPGSIPTTTGSKKLFAPLETLKVSNGLYDIPLQNLALLHSDNNAVGFCNGNTPSGGSLKFLTGFDCSTFNRIQNIPLLQNGVAFLLFIQRLALEGVVGIKGFLSLEITGINISSPFGGNKPSTLTSREVKD
jgi:hypothetical protein